MNLNRVWQIGAQGDASGAEGILVRKHDWESTTKKAANRSWDKVSARIFCWIINPIHIALTKFGNCE